MSKTMGRSGQVSIDVSNEVFTPSYNLVTTNGTNIDLVGTSSGRPEKCELLGKFGILVQCALGLFCVLILVLKWRVEPKGSRRQWRVWALDASKQLAGAAWVHVLNLSQAFLFRWIDATDQTSAECAWYLVGVFCDCVLSTMLCLYLVQFSRPIVFAKLGIDIGDYWSNGVGNDSKGNFVSCRPWAHQTLLWMSTITLVRAALCLCVWLLRGPFFFCADAMLWPWKKQPGTQMLITLVLAPCVGDAFQFWMQDNFLKKDVTSSHLYAHLAPGHRAASKSLIDPCEFDCSRELLPRGFLRGVGASRQDKKGKHLNDSCTQEVRL